jgi:hypothetical protein
MTVQVTLTLSDSVYERAQRLAHNRKDVAQTIAAWLEETLPTAETEPVSLFQQEDDVAVEREREAYLALHPQLKEQFLGRHVAIYGGKLVDFDDDYDALYARIDATYPDEFVWITTIEKEPIPTLTFRSPRFVQDV